VPDLVKDKDVRKDYEKPRAELKRFILTIRQRRSKMRRTKRLDRAVLIGFCTLIIVGLSLINYEAQAAPSKDKPIELKFAHFLPPNHFLVTDGFVPWAKAVEERSGGRVKVTFYPAQSLCKAKDDYDAMVTGVADIAWHSIAYTPGRFPLTEVFFLPYLGSMPAETANNVYQDLYKEFPEMRKEYSEIKVLWLHIGSSAGLLSAKKPIRRLEDLQKLLVRAVGPNAPVAEALGATPVSMSAPDTYLAMEKGTVDAAFIPTEALISFKLSEVTNYLTVGGESGFGPYCTGMNLKVWNSLPPDIQKIIDEESAKASVLNSRGWDLKEQAAIELMKRTPGKEVIYLSPKERDRWREKVQPLYDKWIAEREAKGLPAKQFFDETRRLFEKYEKGSK
jgi:TRAP-type C4-dicarboxylate transport system substrate-binding protein